MTDLTTHHTGTIAVDFDGVLNTYRGWKGEEHLYDLRPGAVEFLEKLSNNYKVVIYTTRAQSPECEKRIWDWLKEHDINQYIEKITADKIRAIVYIDDRAIQFNGDFDETLQNLSEFIPHWKKDDADLNKFALGIVGCGCDCSGAPHGLGAACSYCQAHKKLVEYNQKIIDDCCKAVCACCSDGCELIDNWEHACSTSCLAAKLHGLRK